MLIDGNILSPSQSVSALCGNEIVWHFDMCVKHFSEEANSRDFDLDANWFPYNKHTPLSSGKDDKGFQLVLTSSCS